MTVAIAYTGNYQVELVQQHNDAPSIYTDFLRNNAPGLQPVGTLVANLDEALDTNGFRDLVVQDGSTAAGQRFAYVDSVLHNGTMLELIEADAAMQRAFDYMKQAAAEWDGAEAIRA